VWLAAWECGLLVRVVVGWAFGWQAEQCVPTGQADVRPCPNSLCSPQQQQLFLHCHSHTTDTSPLPCPPPPATLSPRSNQILQGCSITLAPTNPVTTFSLVRTPYSLHKSVGADEAAGALLNSMDHTAAQPISYAGSAGAA